MSHKVGLFRQFFDFLFSVFTWASQAPAIHVPGGDGLAHSLAAL
jgi:hypothetical protein